LRGGTFGAGRSLSWRSSSLYLGEQILRRSTAIAFVEGEPSVLGRLRHYLSEAPFPPVVTPRAVPLFVFLAFHDHAPAARLQAFCVVACFLGAATVVPHEKKPIAGPLALFGLVQLGWVFGPERIACADGDVIRGAFSPPRGPRRRYQTYLPPSARAWLKQATWRVKALRSNTALPTSN
jgi:hypothetical protein